MGAYMSALFQDIYTYKDPDAEILLIQMVDEHDLEVIEHEVALIEEMAPGKPFCLKAVKVNCWNQDLSPWQASPVFGSEGFGEGAAKTLAFLTEELIPQIGDGMDGICADSGAGRPGRTVCAGSGSGGAERSICTDVGAGRPGRTVYIGGYSLAGLFALWSVYQTDLFSGAAAASPSVWFPGFTDYMKRNPVRTKAVYLSLGDKEEKTRNQVMSQVGNAIRTAYDRLKENGCDCVLEWNKGNHFKDSDLRTAKAFAWLLNRERSGGDAI